MIIISNNNDILMTCSANEDGGRRAGRTDFVDAVGIEEVVFAARVQVHGDPRVLLVP